MDFRFLNPILKTLFKSVSNWSKDRLDRRSRPVDLVKIKRRRSVIRLFDRRDGHGFSRHIHERTCTSAVEDTCRSQEKRKRKRGDRSAAKEGGSACRWVPEARQANYETIRTKFVADVNHFHRRWDGQTNGRRERMRREAFQAQECC